MSSAEKEFLDLNDSDSNRKRSVRFKKEPVQNSLTARVGSALKKRVTQSFGDLSQDEQLTGTWGDTSSPSQTLSRSLTSKTYSRRQSSRHNLKMKGMSGSEDRMPQGQMKLLQRKRQGFQMRVAEIEKLAKQLEKESEEKANLHDINQYFDEAPAIFQLPSAQEQKVETRAGHRFSIVQIMPNRFAGGAPGASTINSFGSQLSNKGQKTLPRVSDLSSPDKGSGLGLKRMPTGNLLQSQPTNDKEQMKNLVASVVPLPEGQANIMSKLVDESRDYIDISKDSQSYIHDNENNTFFAPNAKLNESAMIEYGLKKGTAADRKASLVGKDANNGPQATPDLDFSIMDDDEEFLERFDSRGQKMKLRRGKIVNPPLRHIQQSFAVVNFHPSTYITQKDLKMRATSVVYSKYKQIKRAVAMQEQQRRLNWFSSIVIAKKFVRLLLKKARDEINEAHQAHQAALREQRNRDDFIRSQRTMNMRRQTAKSNETRDTRTMSYGDDEETNTLGQTTDGGEPMSGTMKKPPRP